LGHVFEGEGYEVPTDQQILFEFDPKLSGAWLLGKDAARIAESRTSDEISSILSGQALERLVSTMMLTTANVDEEHVRCSKLLYGFRSGFLAA
jgi:predicted nucleotidyltransferase